ncbi:hypothetical protein JCM8115_005776 [Rhodotorula mucilaginosa]|nr:hypothetical protein B0A53_00767 [Rhodotorula sp. CCFEE 5036]
MSATTAAPSATATSNMKSSNELDFNIYGYDPSLVAGIIFLICFGLATLIQAGRVYRSRIWWLVVLVLGGVTEILGWVGRTWSARNVYSLDAFLLQQCCLVLAPCFFSATVYFLLGLIIRSVGRRYSLLPSRAYLWIFCLADLVAIVVQAVGGAMSAIALSDDKSSTPGSRIMLGGIVLQLACMIVFSGLAVVVWMRMRKDRSYRATPHPQAGKLTSLGWGIAIATLTIIIRGGYRSAELAEGWGGYLLQHEAYFCVLDSALMVICQGVFCFVWPNRESRDPGAVKIAETSPTSSRTVLGVWTSKSQDLDRSDEDTLKKAAALP